MNGILEILTEAGEQIAATTVPACLFVKGEGDAKEAEVFMRVDMDGTLARYRFTGPEGEIREGRIDHFFSLDRSSVINGDYISGTVRARTGV